MDQTKLQRAISEEQKAGEIQERKVAREDPDLVLAKLAYYIACLLTTSIIIFFLYTMSCIL